MPAISVIIPYYNGELGSFQRCINSVIQQTNDDFEVVIVNDGSEEKKSAMLKKICEVDNRIRIIEQNNSGVSSARNTGMRIAEGDYYVFVDADDYLSPYYLAEGYELALKTNADILYSFVPKDRKQLVSNEKIRKLPRYSSINDKWLIENTVGTLYTNGKFMFGRGPWARFIKAEIAKKTPFIEGVPLGEDVLWNIEVMTKCKKKILVHTTWYCYCEQNDSVTKKYDPDINDKLIPFYKEITKYLDEMIPLEMYYKRLFRDYKRYIYCLYYGNLENRKGFFWSWRSFNQNSKSEPWDNLRKKECIKSMRRKNRAKLILNRFGLLYPYWKINDLLHRENK